VPLVRAVLRAVVREPLVHFGILGALLFALDAVTTDEPEGAAAAASDAFAVPSGPIVVDATVRAALAEQWAKTHRAPPDAGQLEQLEQRWIDDEVLYREGLARSLAEGDAVVRERIASQMAYVLQSRIVTPEPTEDELRAAFEANASVWAAGRSHRLHAGVRRRDGRYGAGPRAGFRATAGGRGRP